MEQQKILILAANPEDTTRLRVNEELRQIEDGLERAKNRDQFDLKYKLAVRPRDIQRAMLNLKPQIVHFSGHGAGDEGLIFEDETGQTKLVDGEALAGLFELFADKVECVVLNGCYSEIQAVAIAQHVKYVIGMKKAIGDKAAIEFAVGFYDALGSGQSVEFSYKLACAAIRLAGIKEESTPILKEKYIESLLKILNELKNSDAARDIKNAYKACSPSDWNYLSTDDPEEILANIKTMSKGDSKYTRLERFVACLVALIENRTLVSPLNKWGKGNIDKFEDLLNQERQKLEEIKKNQNPYLLVKVSRSLQDSAKKINQEDYYSVDAGFIADGKTYHYKNNPDYKPVFHNKNQKSFTLKEIREEVIIDLLIDIAQEIEDLDLQKLTIEIFMPLDLIDEAVDIWEIEDELDDEPPKLGTNYKVVVRLSERIMPIRKYIIPKKYWQTKWNNLRYRIEKSVDKGLISLESDDLNQLKNKLGKEDKLLRS